MDRSLKKLGGNEIIVLTPVLDVFSAIYKMKSFAEDDLQEEVIKWQNGAVVLISGIFGQAFYVRCWPWNMK